VGGDELAYSSLARQARLIETRELSPVDLVGLYLRRIERFDPHLNSYITVCADAALARARQAEAEIAAGKYLGPLHGIPYGVKDQFNTKGILTTLGSSILADNVPDHDATVIERMDGAGAILLGKQNMHEFGKGSTNRFHFGQPRNPWNLAYHASASSSGSGSGPAAGLCSGALGEDTGGSVRGPAWANGIVGLRPTYGRVSRFGAVMYAYSQDTIGPLARTVEDCAILLQAIAGHDPKDPLSATREVPDYLSALTGGLRGLRIAVVSEMTWMDNTHEEVADAVKDAIEVLASLGAKVTEVSLPLVKYAVPLQMLTSDADGAGVFLHKWLRARWSDFDKGTRRRAAAAALVPAAVYSRAMRARALVRGQILDAFADFDALISPTNPAPLKRIEEAREVVETPADMVKNVLSTERLCNVPYSIANVPAIAVPIGFSSSGLPLSLQIAARPFDEETVFRIAHAYERATGWHEMHPDLEQTVARAPISADLAGE
jgi:aspartyl-tRNA(Asn)/glutamyl-tRNA(Gln) amidotransferase subunit A